MTEHKRCDVPLTVKGAGEAGPAGTVRARFSTFDVIDSDGDVVRPGAFTDGAKVLISSWNHGSWGAAPPIGRGTIRTTATAAELDGLLFLNTTAGRDAYEVLKATADIGEWSYSLDNIVAKQGERDGRSVRLIESVDVHEVSPVIKAESVGTRTLAVKSNEDMKFADEAALVMASVSGLIDRAADVMAKRREKGKTLGTASRHFMEWLAVDLKRLNDLLTDEEVPDPRDEVLREHLRFLANHAA